MHIHNMCRIKFLEFINSDTYDMPIACYKNSKLGAPPAPTHQSLSRGSQANGSTPTTRRSCIPCQAIAVRRMTPRHSEGRPIHGSMY